jgi:hypothetical protein
MTERRRPPNRRDGAAGADRPQERPQVWPLQWQCRFLRDGRIAFLNLCGDGWHVIVERSTVAVVATKADALDFLAADDEAAG